ncbi:multiple epidermal growth factor-like domains protein 10 [Corticium candelabrum]|uniref:multiple epidermal growth factor-like domains protein 10 n=1 Tax=Corticium candelabrum TaxID=121492 RepID=UPI002E2712FC|nr:multiple epidermal growth factor-like domains protein 10 [Corticium candelabrum]
MRRLGIFACAIVAALCQLSSSSTLEGEHVCWANVSVVLTKRISTTQSYTMRTSTNCWDLWTMFSCTRYKLQYKQGYRTVSFYHYVNQSVCCEGYDQSFGRCHAVCMQGCHNGGTCTEPGVCECTSGWTGSNCTVPAYADCSASCENGGWCYTPDYCNCTAGWSGQNCSAECLNGYFGKDCMHTCSCMNDALCERFNGTCTCAAGWHGETCEKTCPAQKYGENCEKDCMCQNGGYCNPVNGNCTCSSGYIGEKCETPCPSWYFGQNCTETCTCVQSQSRGCDNVDGACDCADGWQGSTCQHLCDSGHYGYNCQMNCSCENEAICNPFSGECHCAAGYRGDNCDTLCKEGTYGKGCENKCQCQNNAECSPFDGTCTCTGRWTGDYCDSEVSCESEWEYWSGSQCVLCQCDQDNTMSCDADNGHCTCMSGWSQPNCTNPCDEDSSEECDELTKKSKNNGILIIVGIFTAIAVLVLIATVALLRRRHTQKQLEQLELTRLGQEDHAEGVSNHLTGTFSNTRRYDSSHHVLSKQVAINSEKDEKSVLNNSQSLPAETHSLPLFTLRKSDSDDSSMSEGEDEPDMNKKKPFDIRPAQLPLLKRQQRSTYATIN